MRRRSLILIVTQQELLFDQMRSVVVSDDRLSGGGVVLNAEFLRFAAHWGFQPRSCRPYPDFRNSTPISTNFGGIGRSWAA